MNTLKELNLSDRDFQLIIDGLDQLPNKGLVGEMMGDMLVGVMSRGDEEQQRKLEAEMYKRREKARLEREAMVEDVKILQGKLLMLKRYLQENAALATANDIINHLH